MTSDLDRLASAYSGGNFQRALAEETKAEYERLGLERPTLDVCFMAFVRLLSRFGVFSFGPITISVEQLEEVVDRQYRGKRTSGSSPDFTHLFDLVSREIRRSGSKRPNELHYLLAFMRVGEGVPARVFGELGISPEQVERHVREQRPSSASERLYSPEEAAEYLGIRVETVRSWIRSGRLRASRLAGQRVLRIRASDLEAVLEPVEPNESDDQE